MLLNISNIQHFSTGDGNGIRTTVFFKGCNLNCPWCHNPENLTFSKVELNYPNSTKTEVVGKSVSVEEILPELLDDKDYYIDSGGGVTLSGGEVMLQIDGALLLAQSLSKNGVDVIIDTAGSVPYANFLKITPFVKGYLYDIKSVDPVKVKEIGGELPLILQNLKNLLSERVSVLVRVPLIPTFNTDYNSIKNICLTLKELGVKSVELLPFHKLASSKYEAMGLEYKYKNISTLTKEEISEISKIFNDYDIKTI